MGSANTTSTALLESLKDPAQAAAWREFDERYRPLITAFAVRLSLNASEAEDVAQETLVEFTRAYRAGKYDRTRGRLSSWIISIARHRIAHRRRAVAQAGTPHGGAALADLSDPASLTAVWEDEQRRLIIIRAMEVLRTGRTEESTLLAFELVAVRGVPAEQAARQCGLTVEAVYTAKNRVAGRLRAIVEELTAAWGESDS